MYICKIKATHNNIKTVKILISFKNNMLETILCTAKAEINAVLLPLFNFSCGYIYVMQNKKNSNRLITDLINYENFPIFNK